MSFKADASKIKRWREERQWSQEHLAELAGLGLRTVQRIENGEKASRESLMALAAAFNVEVMALCIDPEEEAAAIIQAKNAKAVSGLRLSFWIHLASYVPGMAVFIGISFGMGYFAMKWPLIWWTIGLVAHGATVAMVEIVSRFQAQKA